MISLSKSKYTTYCQCPLALWFSVHHPEFASPADEASQARMAMGQKVGKLAQTFLGPSVDVTVLGADGHPDLAAMIGRTRELLADPSVENICEASFEWSGNYCAVDILHRVADGWAIYEVKSSSGSDDPKKNKPADLSKYAIDIAYQKYVLEQCGLHVSATYLVRLNSDYVRGAELDLKALFHLTDMAALVGEHMPLVAANVKAAQALSAQPDVEVGTQCKKPYECRFYHHCFGDQPDDSVFTLYRMPFSKKLELFREGKLRLADLDPEDASTMIRQIQLSTYLFGEQIDRAGIRTFLSEKIRYPLYFLDFETVQYAVPEFPDSKPYQQIPFQYSLHYIEEPGGELKHTEFLGDGITDPRRALAEQLVSDIPLGACSTAFNMTFERMVIKGLADLYPDLAPHLLDIREHMEDFLVPFRSGYFYRDDMRGSFSIKKVLPALFPGDPELDYHNLPGSVHNGGEAMTIYPKLAAMTPEERDAARLSLLQYCHLDTLAMVRVWEKLVEVSR